MQKAQWQEHKLLCQAISQLSNSESREFNDPACVSHLTPTEHAKVIDLISKKCMVKCLLNDCEVDMFWNTGAQILIIPVKSFQEHLGSIAIRPLSELLKSDSSEWDRDPLHWIGGSQAEINHVKQ